MKTDCFLEEELQKITSILQNNSIENKDVSFHFVYQNLNIYDLLNYVTCEKIFYFKSKYGDFSFLGLGHSKMVKARDLQPFLEGHPELFLVASFLFEQDPLLTEFYLPEWIFVSKEGRTELTLNKGHMTQSFAPASHFLETNSKYSLNDSAFSRWQSYHENPEHDQWSQIISHCEELFDLKEIEKIVLSRQKIFNYKDTIHSLSFFKKVMEKNNFGNSSYAIFHQTSFKDSFISLTPEKLFSLKDYLLAKITFQGSDF